jgi:hypothetical protein
MDEDPDIRILRAELEIAKAEYDYVFQTCKKYVDFNGSIPEDDIRRLLRDKAVAEQRVKIAEARLDKGLKT